MRVPVIVEIQNNLVIGVHICRDEADCKDTFRKICVETAKLSVEEIEAAYKAESATVGDGSICLASADLPKNLA